MKNKNNDKVQKQVDQATADLRTAKAKKAMAKATAASAKAEEHMAKIRTREKNGGVTLQLKFADSLPDKNKKEGSWQKPKMSRIQKRGAKKQLRGSNGRFLPNRRPLLFRDATKKASPKSEGVISIEYKKQKVRVGGKDYYIPVDDDGYVPKTILASRLQNVTEGSRKPGAKRNVIRDLCSDADTVIKGDKLTPEDVKQWWAYPNESDIDGIDTTKDWVKLKGYSTKKYNSAKNIILLNVNKKEDATIRKVLMDSFTKGELDKMASGEGVTVVVEDGIAGAGAYDHVNKTIYLSPEFATASGTITHEFIHHLRSKDKSRKGEITKSRIPSDSIISPEDRNLEESATTAETVARVTPYSGFKNMSYYWRTSGRNEKIAREQIDRDRILFVGNNDVDSKGLRGKRAINSVERNFDASEIAKLKYDGSKETAIETVGKYKARK